MAGVWVYGVCQDGTALEYSYTSIKILRKFYLKSLIVSISTRIFYFQYHEPLAISRN